MPTKRTRAVTSLAAATVVIAAAAVPAQAGAFATPRPAGSVTILADGDGLGADFADGIEVKASGGTIIPVTVTGGTVGTTSKEFAALRVTAKIGGVPARVTWVDQTHLKVTAPATKTAGTVPMQLFRNGVAGPESSARVAYLPIVGSVAPAKLSSAGGATVTITGQGFLGVDAGNPASVRFGPTAATSFQVVSATKITAVAPAGTNGAEAVTVTTTGGASPATTAARVTYRAVLGIDASSEPVAKAGGGPVVLTITGATLGANAKEFAAERVSARVGTRTIAAGYVDATHVKITLPRLAGDSAEVTMIHDGFAGPPAEVTLAPVVTSLSARSGTIAGGTRVSVKVAAGDLAGATDFKFGAEPAACTQQGTGTAITYLCTVPPATEAGPVWVSFTSAAGTPSRFTAASLFSYTN